MSSWRRGRESGPSRQGLRGVCDYLEREKMKLG